MPELERAVALSPSPRCVRPATFVWLLDLYKGRAPAVSSDYYARGSTRIVFALTLLAGLGRLVTRIMAEWRATLPDRHRSPDSVKERTDRILGATIVARHAGEMINEITLAMVAGIGLRTLARVIHAYPTQAEAIRKAADAYNRTRLTPAIQSLLRRWLAW